MTCLQCIASFNDVINVGYDIDGCNITKFLPFLSQNNWYGAALFIATFSLLQLKCSSFRTIDCICLNSMWGVIYLDQQSTTATECCWSCNCTSIYDCLALRETIFWHQILVSNTGVIWIVLILKMSVSCCSR